MSSHENYSRYQVRPSIGRVGVETVMGDNTTPSNFKRRDVVFQPLAPMNGVYKAQKVSSSTSPKRDASSETSSDDFHTTYGDHDLNGMDRHMLGMLESPDISQAEANQHFNNYFK